MLQRIMQSDRRCDAVVALLTRLLLLLLYSLPDWIQHIRSHLKNFGFKVYGCISDTLIEHVDTIANVQLYGLVLVIAVISQGMAISEDSLQYFSGVRAELDLLLTRTIMDVLDSQIIFESLMWYDFKCSVNAKPSVLSCQALMYWLCLLVNSHD